MLFNMTVTASLDRRGVSGNFTNNMLFRSNVAIGNNIYFELAQDVVEEYADVFTDSVTIKRVGISRELTGRQTDQEKGRYMRFDFDVPGRRVLPENVDAAALSNVAEFKKQAAYGSVGRQLLRGAYMETEVAANETGSTDTQGNAFRAAFDAFAAGLPDKFSDRGMPMVMPAPPGEDFENGAREVVEMLYVGPSERQLNSTRTSLQTRLKQAAKAEIRELERQASIEAARSGDDDPDSWNPIVLAALTAAAGLLISRYGSALLVATGLTRWARVLLARIP